MGAALRVPARARQRTADLISFPAPKGGWVANQNISRPDPGVQGAWQLTNFFPTATGAELRAGSNVHATLGGEDPGYVKSFLRYKNGAVERLFAAIDTGIYDVSVVEDPEVSPDPVVDGLTSGLWVPAQFATTGGVYLVAVNGADNALVFDGEVWFPATDQEVDLLPFDGETVPFEIGETVTGGTSGATATVVAINVNAGEGYLLVSNVANGPFEDDEALTGSEGGAAVVDGENITVFLGVDGVGTNELSYVWTFKNRLFFIQRSSMTAWYLDIDAIGGTITPFPMGGVFSLGGSLMFGATWSLDSGASGGLSEQCVFVTTEGEVAVYQGSNPSSAEAWSKVGVYLIGKPLGPNAWFRAGGDIIIATDIGLIPLSQAINRDIAALSPASVSYPIETAWNSAVSSRRSLDWNCTIWPERQMVVVALPTLFNELPEMLVANARTGAWCNFTGWDGACLSVFQGRMYFGSSDGRVIEAYVTGADCGETFTGIYVPLFTDAETPSSHKTTILSRPAVRVTQEVTLDLSMQFDYEVEDLTAPPASSPAGVSVWGDAVWGEAVWGGARTRQHQQGVYVTPGYGYAFAPAMQVTSGSISPIECEIIRIDVTFEVADIMT